MKNYEIAQILYQIADILEILKVEWKPTAYRRAARSIETMSEDIVELYKRKELQKIPGVGIHIADKIKEIIETGSLKYLEKIKKETPFDYEGLMSIEGMGPKKVMALYQKLKIKTLKDLEKAAKAHKIRELFGFGEKTEQSILNNIELARTKKNRILLSSALTIGEDITSKLKKFCIDIKYAGSLRRMKETIGDIDILASSENPEKAFEEFSKFGEVIIKGPTKCSIRLQTGFHVDLRMIKPESFGSALQYFTGSQTHNIALRRIAISKGYKLSEYGLFSGAKRLAGSDEKEIYTKLGMQYIPPELRENSGEIEVSLKNLIPELVGYNDILGDLQIHTSWSDGENTIEEMIKSALEMKYKYLCISDHAGNLKIANAMNEQRLKKQIQAIKKIEKKFPEIKILKGAEVEILPNGNLGIKNEVLKELDIVLIAVHSRFKMPENEMTERIVKAMSNDYATILAHPTGRKVMRKEPYSLNFEKIMQASKDYKVFMEINSWPERLDLSDINARAAIENKCRLFINTDSHATEQLKLIRLGIGQARRAWAKKSDILNTLDYEKLIRELKS